MSPALTTLSTSTSRTLMMPFAFDLISTLVIGSTLPVATTERTMVPRSTVAMRDGSISADAPRSVTKPYAAASSTTIAAAPANSHFLDRLVPLAIWSFYEHFRR
jgi:hypothetical protein